MLKYKGFNLPVDLVLLAGTLLSTIYHFTLLKTSKPNELLARTDIKKADQELDHKLSKQEEIALKKVYKASTYYIYHLLHSDRPCLCRALVLEHWCRNHKIKAQIVIGVNKRAQALESHAWLQISNCPFNENEAYLNKFTPILEQH